MDRKPHMISACSGGVHVTLQAMAWFTNGSNALSRRGTDVYAFERTFMHPHTYLQNEWNFARCRDHTVRRGGNK